MEINPGSFLAAPNLKSYSADNNEYWYIKIIPSAALTGNTITCRNPRIKTITSRDGRESKFLNGQLATGVPISEAEYIKKGKPAGYERGILKILNIREKDIPAGKWHEIFLLYRDGIEDNLPTFEATDAVEQFHALAMERTREDEKLPFELKGSNRNSNPSKDNQGIELRTGDIVFFEPDKNDYSKVGEVSVSSIWRHSAGGTSHDYFNAISPETLPFNPKRNSISIAEQMFGFVEQDFSEYKSLIKNRQARALAGRLRFSHAKEGKDNGSNCYIAPITLKILDSPKPPSPDMYFKHNSGAGGYISKQELSPKKHHPHGRKFYLHQKQDDKPWETLKPNDHCKQKVKITPVKDEAVFYFHIDYDNLSELELGLLLYSLNPSDTFRHKLGMGKPIGLGTVKIEPVGLFTVNRKDRYSKQTANLFNEKRYHNAWVKDGTNSWPPIYDREKTEYGDGSLLIKLDYEKIKKDFADKMDKDIQKALEILGDPAKVTIPAVHYPQLKGKDIENENFRWFVKNDDRNNTNKQFLEPIKLTGLK
ncbi:MAG: TIGR03986 family CRISPR-associated RAMP protein [Deltaproteobacteria bacterium]|nr:TIGR03986 family CRISPR-associated RAMP protein [Deltaproteobacteria bacterium]